jgi:hypothetical protein
MQADIRLLEIAKDVQIEKADGCDHMICMKCLYEFCWSCLADYNAIRQDGDHRHDSKCKHYAAY